MKILDVKSLKIPEIKIIKFGFFRDHRGYFAETFRKSDLTSHPQLGSLKDADFSQSNESFSVPGTIRGLHFQWDPLMGKLVRTIRGHMIDLVLDIRKGSPTFGHIIAYDMPLDENADFSEWIWIPPGFAHGNFFPAPTTIEYFCTGHYNPRSEAGISPFSGDIDWDLCDPELKDIFEKVSRHTNLVTDKDKNGFSLTDWKNNKNSDNFIYQ